MRTWPGTHVKWLASPTAEASDSNPEQCGFDSHASYEQLNGVQSDTCNKSHASYKQRNGVQSDTCNESDASYDMRQWWKSRHGGFKSRCLVREGANPSWRTILLVFGSSLW